MSRKTVELVREQLAIWTESPYDLGEMLVIDDEVVYEDDFLPDHVGETFRGHEGMRRAWASATADLEDLEIDTEWVRDAGVEVVSCHRIRARGKGSGVELEDRYAYVWRLSEGRVVQLRAYRDPAAALEAAGLAG